MLGFKMVAGALVVAGCAAVSPLSAAAAPAGVVLLHGKAGTPAHMQVLADALRQEGYLVATPEMPWSAARQYDRTLEDAHQEIDASILALEAAGADAIVVGGHSMGANMAMGYAATHGGIAAVLALGPGQTVESGRFAETTRKSVERAREIAAAGRGGEKQPFVDIHLGLADIVETTADAYLSYFDPSGLANMPATAESIEQPFLWVVGRRDANMLERGRAYAFERAPGTPFNRYLEVDADHMGTPDASVGVVVAWLKEVLAGGGS